MTPYRKLLVACDGSEGSNIAAVHAAILANKLGAELHAVWVRSRLPRYPGPLMRSTKKKSQPMNFLTESVGDLNRLLPTEILRSESRCGRAIPLEQLESLQVNSTVI
jgi:nucleotide-binding universal stress UspA family protein